jgi:hypothetical protein
MTIRLRSAITPATSCASHATLAGVAHKLVWFYGNVVCDLTGRTLKDTFVYIRSSRHNADKPHWSPAVRAAGAVGDQYR